MVLALSSSQRNRYDRQLDKAAVKVAGRLLRCRKAQHPRPSLLLSAIANPDQATREDFQYSREGYVRALIIISESFRSLEPFADV